MCNYKCQCPLPFVQAGQCVGIHNQGEEYSTHAADSCSAFFNEIANADSCEESNHVQLRNAFLQSGSNMLSVELLK